jgi:DNA transposition AAA+ family ATPase
LSLRDQVRKELHVYMAQTGLTLAEIASRTGYAHRTMIQFSSGARYGDGDGAPTAEGLRQFMRSNPAPRPELPGKLYLTEAVRRIDEMIAYARRGRWGVVYGPAGAQKSFTFEYRAAEMFGDGSEPGLVYIYLSAVLTPYALLRRIARGLGAPAAPQTEALRESILFALGRRHTPAAIIIDEGQHLGSCLSTMEILREIGDRGRVGILIAGHDDVFGIFAPRRGMQFEQWRSRIQQKRVRLLGLSRREARTIISQEEPGLREASVERILRDCTVHDNVSDADYISARVLFNAFEDLRDARRGRENGKAVN